MPPSGEEAILEGPQIPAELPARNHGRLPEGAGLSQCPEANLNPSIDANNLITAPTLMEFLKCAIFTVPSTGQESVNLTSQQLYKVATITIIPLLHMRKTEAQTWFPTFQMLLLWLGRHGQSQSSEPGF